MDVLHDGRAETRRRRDRLRWALVTVLVVVGFGAGVYALQSWLTRPDPRIAAGKAEFQRFCAGCHGEDARGKGPLAAGLARPPRDLTTIALRHGATFDVEDVERFIDGRADVAAHGPRDMPVWAEIWRDEGEAEARARIEALVAWLWSVQR